MKQVLKCCEDMIIPDDINEKNYCYFDLYGKGGTHILNYCPFCGKKIEVIEVHE